MGKVDDLDLEKSKLVKIIGKIMVISTLTVIAYYSGYGIGKGADYICKKITDKNIYQHIQDIQLPTEPREIYSCP